MFRIKGRDTRKRKKRLRKKLEKKRQIVAFVLDETCKNLKKELENQFFDNMALQSKPLPDYGFYGYH